MPLPDLTAIEDRLNTGRLGFDFYMDDRILVEETKFRVSTLGDVYVSRRDTNGLDSEDGGGVELIFKIVDNHGEAFYYRKDGYADSYGDTSWDRGLTQVFPRTKTVVYFD